MGMWMRWRLIHSAVEPLLPALLQAAQVDSNRTDRQTFYNDRLRSAAKKGHVCGVRALLEVGANPNSKDRGGKTALHWAAETGQARVCSALLDCPAFTEANAKTNVGRTALHHAAYKGHLHVVKALHELGADLQAASR